MSNLTKSEIVSRLDQYDRATLDRLLSYAELIVIPEEDLLVSVTMSQMVAHAHRLADIYFPTWTDRSKSDFGQFLVELCALFSEKDYWYVNNFANEFFTQNMTVYTNAFVRSIEKGYYPNLLTSSVAKFKIRVTAGNSFLLKSGDLVLSRSGTDFQFSNSKPYFIPDSITPQDYIIEVSHGIYQTKQTEFNGKSLKLVTSNIDIKSVQIFVNDIEYSYVPSFAEARSTDKVFIALPDSNSSVEIFFGRDGYGFTPEPGAQIRAIYRVGGGTIANLPALGAAYTIAENPGTRIDAGFVIQLNDLKKGKNASTLEEIKRNSILFYRTKGTVGNNKDAVYTLQLYSDIKKAKSINIGNNVFVYAIPADGNPADAAFMDEVAARIQPVLLMSFNAFGVTTDYVNIAPLAVTCFMLSGSDLADSEAEIRNLIAEYTDPLGRAEYGRSFSTLELLEILVSNVPGLQNVQFTTVAGGIPGDVTVGSTGIMKRLEKYNAITPYTVTTSVIGGIVVAGGDITINMQFSS